MTYDEYRKELPDLPEAQVRTVWMYRQSGWEWRGDDGEGNIEMTRPDTMETIEAIYIKPDGMIREIPANWLKTS